MNLERLSALREKEPMRENKEGGWEREMHSLRSSLRAWGHSAHRTGAWPAAHSTRAMKAGCKQPAQMAFEGCAAVRSKLRAGAYSFADPTLLSSAKALAGPQLELTARCGRSLRGR
jgi:hypothetical protein